MCKTFTLVFQERLACFLPLYLFAVNGRWRDFQDFSCSGDVAIAKGDDFLNVNALHLR